MRIVEIVLPAGERRRLEQALDEAPTVAAWSVAAEAGLLVTHVVVRPECTQQLLDALQNLFSSYDEFRVVVQETTAVVPEPPKPEKPDPGAPPASPEARKKRFGVSREELVQAIESGSAVSPVFLAMTALSTVVACIGLRRNSGPVVIGAMVIAPLLGPNVALGLATTLWDRALLRLALAANAIGVATAFAIALGVGSLLGADATIPEIASRTSVGPGDVALALASGTAGALSLATGAPASLIGVMVAVALLPPVATFGMLLGAGQLVPAYGALLLLAANVIGVNLSGVATFLVLGVRPRRFWEAERAARAARIAVGAWVVLLSLVLAAMLLRERL